MGQKQHEQMLRELPPAEQVFRAMLTLSPVQFLSFMFVDYSGHDILALAERLHCDKRAAQIEVYKARQEIRRRLGVSGDGRSR